MELVFEPWSIDTPSAPPSDKHRAACRDLWAWRRLPVGVMHADIVKVEIAGEGQTLISWRMNGTATIDGRRLGSGPIEIVAVSSVDEMPPPSVVEAMTSR